MHSTIRETIKYIAYYLQDDHNFSRTKLAKILWFVDTDANISLGKPITNCIYQKYPYGLIPQGLPAIIQKMKTQGLIIEEKQNLGYRYSIIGYPDLGKFSNQQREVLDRNIHRYNRKTAKWISTQSHGLGWQAATLREIVPLETILLRHRKPTQSEFNYAQSIQFTGYYNNGIQKRPRDVVDTQRFREAITILASHIKNTEKFEAAFKWYVSRKPEDGHQTNCPPIMMMANDNPSVTVYYSYNNERVDLLDIILVKHRK